MLGHVDVQHTAPVVAEDDQDEKHLQPGGWHDKEIHVLICTQY
jgi:hypothetical protein